MIPIINSLKNFIFPEPSESEQREKMLIDRYHLRKDNELFHRYWLDDMRYIAFDREDPQSVAAAEQVLAEYFRNPKIEVATRKQRQKQQAHSTPRHRESVLDEVEEAFESFEPIALGAEEWLTRDLNTDPDFEAFLFGSSEKSSSKKKSPPNKEKY